MDWILILIKMLFEKLSPQLREVIVNAVKNLEKIAANTDNKWDDLAVRILKLVLGIA